MNTSLSNKIATISGDFEILSVGIKSLLAKDIPEEDKATLNNLLSASSVSLNILLAHETGNLAADIEVFVSECESFLIGAFDLLKSHPQY
jgi:hypothetical protein